MKNILLTLCIAFGMSLTANAQCGIENTAFKSGESLEYDLYFNWQFIWVKVGAAQMDTKMTKFEGKDAWKSYLITRGNSKLDKYFTMRDTLLSYCNPDLSPMYFRKGAREGSRYYVDEIWYSYPNGNCQLKKHRIDSDGEQHWKTSTYRSCIYDMMSIFLRARNFDGSKLKKGQVISTPISDASSLSNSWLEYRGKETFKMNGSKEKFRCLVMSFYERDNGKSKELIPTLLTTRTTYQYASICSFRSEVPRPTLKATRAFAAQCPQSSINKPLSRCL